MFDMEDAARKASGASYVLASASTAEKNRALLALAERLDAARAEISEKNAAVFLTATLLTAIILGFYRYLILSTKRNRRLQRIPAVPVWSGSLDHQMNIGLPTMWSSGTKPQ